MEEKEYFVMWAIDLYASSPEEAAKKALEYIVNGTAKVFEVTQDEDSISEAKELSDNGKFTTIDLVNEEDW